MYNLSISGAAGELSSIKALFGEKYDFTEDLSQTNVLVILDNGKAEIPDSKLLFAVCDMTDNGLPESVLDYCAERGICVFRDADTVKDFIENGNAVNAAGLPDIDLGPFGSDMCRIVIMMKGIDDPILLAAMMFSGMDVRAVAGGLNGDHGCALVALREPVTRIPHVDGILKVRVLQDI